MSLVQPLVSVVVPVYNQEMYLESSVNAILHQSYRQLEIILVNDGSTDTSTEKLHDFAVEDSRVLVIQKENGGLVDATIAGIRQASGQYIVFMDPDDYIGSDYIANFVQALDLDTDVVAAGFYHDDRHMLTAFSLKEDRIYKGEEISFLRRHLLDPVEGSAISSYLFVSRWNKMYRTSCAKNVADKFEEYKDISLGEDTIFSYLMLLECTCVKTLKLVNSYYYNIASSTSMMKNTATIRHISNARKVRSAFGDLLTSTGEDRVQADLLYYFLIESLLTRLLSIRDRGQFIHVYREVRKERSYMEAVMLLLRKASSRREFIVMHAKALLSPHIYYALMTSGKSKAKRLRGFISGLRSDLKNVRLHGVHYARKAIFFRRNRDTAFVDLERQLPELERRIIPMLTPFIGKSTNLEECPVSHKVFVFWWDGFDSAPDIVRTCLKSVRRTHPDDEIIELSKSNYEKYTDIDIRIRDGFARGDISVQTFSDILRFNVLKNNGGTWVDATLYFSAPYDLTLRLSDKSFESMNCVTTPNFLKYKGASSTWTGFFIAARKNSLFVTAMDSIFKEYFLKYGKYPIYLFIDAVFMICLRQGLDNNVLNCIHKNPGYLFELTSLLGEPFRQAYLSRLANTPQKMSWFYDASGTCEDSVYDRVFREDM